MSSIDDVVTGNIMLYTVQLAVPCFYITTRHSSFLNDENDVYLCMLVCNMACC